MADADDDRRIQKVCTLWTHQPDFSTDDVVFNADRFAELNLQPGSLAQIIPIISGTSARDFVQENPKRDHPTKSKRDISHHNGKLLRITRGTQSSAITFDENGSYINAGKDTDESRSYCFVARDASAEMKQKNPNLQISISSTVAAAFGFRSRSIVVVATANEEDHSASHIELTFRDEYLSRGDMWRLVTSELSERTVYRDQKILFLGTVKATVKNVYINGEKKKSGYFCSTTRPIFRSESARYTVFIQMSKEMWNFDAEGAGEIMFNKVINGFLPELFKNWMSINAHHLVSIILFARLEYRDDQLQQHNIAQHLRKHATGHRDGSRDFYKVVVSEMASNDWIKILYQLKKEFRTFLKDISVEPQHDDGSDETKFSIVGKPCGASKGNILEAINMATAQFSHDYIDRDLVRTGISVVVITAGTGVYEVDYDMLKLTTDNLMGSGIGIDLVCLSPMPLHSVPLFMYRNPRVLESTLPTAAPSPSTSLPDNTPRQHDLQLRKIPSAMKQRRKPAELIPGEWSYAIPHWVDVSFWSGTADEQAMLLRHKKKRTHKNGHRGEQFHLRCRLYELQMMGLMENEMTNISVAKAHEHPLHPWHQLRHQISGRPITKDTEGRIRELEMEWMNEYDDYVFRPAAERDAIEEAARKRAQKSALDGSKLTADSSGRTNYAYAEDVSSQGGSLKPGAGYLDWKMREKVPVTPLGVGRKASISSIATTATTNTTATSATLASRTSSLRVTRQISFGGSLFGPPKAMVSTDVAGGVATIKPPTFVKDRGTETPTRDRSNSSKFTDQFKAALSRAASSQTTTPTLRTLAEDAKEKSRPINISLNKAAANSDHGPADVLPSTSADTLNGEPGAIDKNGKAKADRQTGTSTGVVSLRKQVSHLSTSGDARPIPQTLSLSRALAPWLVLVNPCNPRKNNQQINSEFRRWQHVFPRQRRTGSIKWKSLCSPASVPLTNEFFPTAEQLATEYHESPYHLNQDEDDDMAEAPKTRESLIRELIAFRLSHGFQLIVGEDVAEFVGNKGDKSAHIFDKNYMAQDGATVFMSVGSAIHQLLCGSDGEVEIRRFNRKPAAEYESFETTNAVVYKPYIQTVLASGYEQREITFKVPKSDYNWNLIDSFIAGHHDQYSDVLRFWRARFVLIPVDIPSHGRGHGVQQRRQPLATVTEDTEEEIRLEGIRKLTQAWQKNRILPPEERALLNRRKDPNPLAIEYQTRDTSAVITAGADSIVFTDNDPAVLTTESNTYNTKDMSIPKLAHDLQGEKGIKVLDRRWHWRLHYNCFVGSDLTSWLLLNFEDVQTRDDAVALGNKLMEQGLFQHVQSKHQFRDGNFFYQIAASHRAPRPDSRMGGWFGGRKNLGSVPSTPMAETPRIPTGITGKSYIGSGGSRPSTGSSSSKSGDKTPTKPHEKRKAILSNVMRYDVDPRKKSYRPEIINLHYDRLHNPDNCYHLRIDWMNVTAKFIEDAVVNWATTVERYGLKLVELPLAEACAITDDHPFRSPYEINLAVPPPMSPAGAHVFDNTSFEARKIKDKFCYHKALLKKFSFVLDGEAKGLFPQDVDVTYSWGKPDYKFTQYIHKSGIVIAQITDEGSFLLLANRLYNDRTAGRRESGRVQDMDVKIADRRHVGAHVSSHRSRSSPMSSPMVKPITSSSEGGNNATVNVKVTAEDIKDEFEKFCRDEGKLRGFYEMVGREARKPGASPSPRLLGVGEGVVPELLLPPRVLAGRGVSPGRGK
ncbi:hypothetical protein EJ08DRAFT_650710 [Tothia fuscella]|uniref:Vacuolar membrane-associated protein IML1 n=1 Tax=Tothia fuscella TaxID=1048955 RepID=A0A9P4NPF1_9PEZI|nr:hypothetical protein EJ08DRAFT_650710 [Tothia fuscella]